MGAFMRSALLVVSGDVDVGETKDSARQIAWFTSQGLLKGPIDPETVIDRCYVTDLPIQ